MGHCQICIAFLADLVNCHVLSASSLLQLLDNMIDAANEDNVPQVCNLFKNLIYCILNYVKSSFYFRYDVTGMYLQF